MDPVRHAATSVPAPAPAHGVVGVLLAAGHARRFGSDKRRVPWPGHGSLMEAALAPLQAVCPRVVAVLPPGDAWGLMLCRRLQVEVAWSFRRGAGLAASLSAALPQVRGAPAIVVALADMGDVRADTLRALIAAWQRRPEQPVLPVFAGQPGNPRLIPAPLYARLERLSGDDGVRRALDWKAAQACAVDDPGVLRDLDTPAGLG
ncbi:NTP transferase domain-containing protein [Paracidovorax valerianellae]|uniref:Molybdenum cofactor cytidylyltransferase n=1 Tax=Paracidovorax valerianellae TaxID=187868 RepID=A0A1G6SHB5_9BURK|nr:NTP transferase domain-containing protein [Paracidovorax valerianellae]MDA8444287.1 NTP transferase domain-containing protein [Paracidovorax valerianellae]SDD16031.1 molybdenum cofactor cytidylyltransferase [Paracidovorax valerianellae]